MAPPTPARAHGPTSPATAHGPTRLPRAGWPIEESTHGEEGSFLGTPRAEIEVMLASIGPAELVLILVIAILLFGAGRIATVGKGLGDGIKNFRRALKEETKEDVS